ncbi:MAG: GNAT family N-acetyltransferase [Pseudomonadota bacterium]
MDDRVSGFEQTHDGVAAIEAARWNTLNRGNNPFVDHRFLASLEQSGCLTPDSGWLSQPIDLEHSDGFAPAYLKHHSHGEFVFDWAWVDAAQRSGLPWYPKLLVGAPYSPITGPRLLGDGAQTFKAINALIDEHQLMAASINFCDETDRALLLESDWLERHDWQFHWQNPGYRDFDDFLDQLKRKPRKNIRRERRLAQAAGWSYRWLDGNELDDEQIAFVHRCYQTTFVLYGNLPALNQAFFEQAACKFGSQFLVCIASQHDQDLACGVFWRNQTHLYGRYWGALCETRDVHFETCYYQGIDYAIREGLRVFEPGAQGTHKIRRGFMPVKTWSYHRIRHPGLREGIRRWLQMEKQALANYREELQALVPFAEAQASPMS